ncbi:MAG: hypothetical protein C0518_15325 [Opitutus sp.]|nr:hypothetical protein [Opitutus sp.]
MHEEKAQALGLSRLEPLANFVTPRAVLFRRILGFKDETVSQREKRHAQRHAVGEQFPLKVVLNVQGRDEDATLNQTRDGRGRNWTVQVVNLSSSGARLRVPSALYVQRGDTCTLTLIIGNFVIVQRGTVAHFRTQNTHAMLGMAFGPAAPEMQKSYLQLLEPLSLGESLRPVPAKRVAQDTPGQHKEQYHGSEDSLLTIWRVGAGGPVNAFEYRMRQCYARGAAAFADLQVFVLEDKPRQNYASTTLQPSPSHAREIQTLFRWIVPNLSSAVPEDAREFLARFAQSGR